MKAVTSAEKDRAAMVDGRGMRDPAGEGEVEDTGARTADGGRWSK